MSLIVRYVLKLSVVLLAIYVVGVAVERRFAGVDAWVYSLAGRMAGWEKGESAQLHRPGQPVVMEQRVVERLVRHYPVVYYTLWDDDALATEATLPKPKIQELATILHCLSNRVGVRAIGVSCPLMWEDADDLMAHHMLSRALQSTKQAVLGMPGRMAAQAAATPDLLSQAVIPPACIQGQVSGLPSANTPLPYHIPLAEGSPLWAPDYVEDELMVQGATQGNSLPLLCRWNGVVMATLPLRLAMAELGLKAEEVHVRLGKSIRLGNRLLPLDAHGCTPLGAARTQHLPLAEVLAPRHTAGESGRGGFAIVSRPYAPGQADARAVRLAATVSALMSSDQRVYIPTDRPKGNHLLELNFLQASVAGRLITLALMAGWLIWLPMLPRRMWRGCWLGVGCFMVAAVLVWGHYGVWASLSAGLCVWLLIYPALLFMGNPLRR